MSSGVVRCKRCGCKETYKAGKSRILNQRYQCKRCDYRFVEHDGRSSFEKQKKRVAIFFTYHELDISISRIAIMLKLKEKTVERWIKIEEKAFKDNAYRDKMVFYRSMNYYYDAIRTLLDVAIAYDRYYDYDNGNEPYDRGELVEYYYDRKNGGDGMMFEEVRR